MNLPQLLEKLKNNPAFMENVTAWRTVPPRQASYAPWPEGIDERLPSALARHGVQKLSVLLPLRALVCYTVPFFLDAAYRRVRAALAEQKSAGT